jgi:hypothetical protein
MDAGGALDLAASSATDLVAICDEGQWNDRPQAERAYVSADGGSTFHRVPTPIPVRGPNAVASPRPNVWVVAGADSSSKGVLLRTPDGGRTWTTVDREEEGAWSDLGFTSPQQGVVISQGPVGRLLMTFDGGQTWAPVSVH